MVQKSNSNGELGMCIVSDTSLKELIIPKEEYEVAKKWFEKRDWGSIEGRILIDPFNTKNSGPFSYDLCVGDEVFELNSKRKISLISNKEVYIEPGEIFFVLTQEYVGLPREFAASVMPRFTFVREGVMQSMTKIDPTWYGKLVVAIENHSKDRFLLKKSQTFCTLVIHRLDKPVSKILSSEDVPALGKESIDFFLRKKEK
jgi:deoxycytidine triphosphate deaminase